MTRIQNCRHREESVVLNILEVPSAATLALPANLGWTCSARWWPKSDTVREYVNVTSGAMLKYYSGFRSELPRLLVVWQT